MHCAALLKITIIIYLLVIKIIYWQEKKIYNKKNKYTDSELINSYRKAYVMLPNLVVT